MMLDNLLKIDPFSIGKKEKNRIFTDQIKSLTYHHYKFCKKYKKIIKNLKFRIKNINKLENFPMLPVRLFKNFDFKSVSEREVVKKIVSSGTSGKKLSKIYLDKKNAHNQVKVLGKIMSTILGNKRLPMLIIDQNPELFNKSIFNARAAAIYGFSIFGKKHCFLLSKENNIDYISLNNFLEKYSKDKFLIFGFTSLVYENLIKKISTRKLKSNFENGVLLHGGGWKKLEKLNINNEQFKKKLFNKIKIKNIYNYYGLVEQAGSIFIECKKCGHLVTSIFSDIFIRDREFNIVKNGQKGLIQLLSLLPTSYPGHNILTEDIGEIIDEEKYKCEIKGKHFLVHGRAKEAEIRGCSDVG
jgi:phenylacetate-coenzyme A ligase PaaK-like adenylate-forming protein